MQQSPAIAVITPNILMGIGLKAILEKIIPMADVELFNDFASFEEAGADRFFHYFVTSQLFVAHRTFFQARRNQTILLTASRRTAYPDMHAIDIHTSEESVVREILHMHHGAHPNRREAPPSAAPAAPLSSRETEVLTLVARGYMNKEIAQQLQIGLTTVISHRRNIMDKLGIHSVAGLAIYAMTEGYVDEDEL